MDDLTLDPVAPHRARIGDALIVLGALGLFGGLLLEQPFAMLAGLILFVVGLVVSKSKLQRSLAMQRSEAQSRASAHTGAPTRPSVARVVVGIVGFVALFVIGRSIWR